MKNIIPIVVSSLLSAFIAIFVYKQLESPNVIYSDGTNAPAVYTNFDWDDPFSGHKQRTFISSFSPIVWR